MTYANAVATIGAQTRNLRKIRDIRITHDGYEYRVDYRGGFAAYIAIDRRPVGTRNFKYFGGVGAYGCWTAFQAMELVRQKIGISA